MNFQLNLPDIPCNLSGDGVSLYGPINLDAPRYAVRVDNGNTDSFSAKKNFYVPQVPLYLASSLGPGTHNLTLTVQIDSPHQTFAVDYAVVFTTTAPLSTIQMGYVIKKGFQRTVMIPPP